MQATTTNTKIDRVKALYTQQKAIEQQLIDALPQAYPVGTRVAYFHNDHLQIGEVVAHGGVNPEVRVMNVKTGSLRWLSLWHLLAEHKYKQ